MTDELRAEGWGVLPISLQKILLDRIRATGEANIEALTSRERRLFDKDPDRALVYLRDKIGPYIEGPNGIAADVAKLIGDLRTRTPIEPIGRSCSSAGPGPSTPSSAPPRC